LNKNDEDFNLILCKLNEGITGEEGRDFRLGTLHVSPCGVEEWSFRFAFFLKHIQNTHIKLANFERI
jgi:hypothetical protein